MGHHVSIPTALISHLHYLNILLKPLTLFIAGITNIFLKQIQMTNQKVNFDTNINVKFAKFSKQIIH